MSKIEYDPVKDRFARLVRNSKKLRKIFYVLLDLIFLRSWHIRRILLSKGGEFEENGEWKLLDAGCGFGQYDHFLLKNFPGITIDSVDVKKDYLDDNSRFFREQIQQGKIRFYEQDLLNLDARETYNMLICIDVLEHIENDVQVIENLSRSLKRDGYFLMHSPSHYSEEDAAGDDTFVGEHARTGYSKAEIEKKLMEADLLPVKTHYTYGKWGRRAWIISVKWPMLMFTKLKMFAVIPLLFYYPVVLPFCILMNFADLYTRNHKGNGIYALARKI
jgi:SAM-dependent methyltransferase